MITIPFTDEENPAIDAPNPGITPATEPTLIDLPSDPVANVAPDLVTPIFGENYAQDEEETAYQKELSDWNKKTQKTLSDAVLKPDEFFAGADLGFARSDSEGRMKATIDLFLMAQNKGEMPLNSSDGLGRRFALMQNGLQHFGKEINSEEAFYQEVKSAFQGRRDKQDISMKVAEEASKAALFIAAGEQAKSFGDLREELKGQAGYSPEDDFEFSRAFRKRKARIQEIFEPFSEELKAVISDFYGKSEESPSVIMTFLTDDFLLGGEDTAAAIKAKKENGANISNIYEKLSAEEREGFKEALGMLARSLPKEEQEAFLFGLSKKLLPNWTKKVGRDLSSVPGSAFDGTARMVHEGGTVGWQDFFGTPQAIRERDEKEAKIVDEFARKADFIHDVRKIYEQEFDPIDYATEEGSWARVAEDIFYSAPGAIATSAVAAIPYVGQASFLGMMKESSYQGLREQFEENGDSYEVARDKANVLSNVSAPIQMAIERFQIPIFKGKVPLFEGFTKVLTKRMNSLGARAATRIGIASIAEGTVEMGQEYVDPLLQELAHEAGMKVPNQEWLNGKDGIFDGFWKKYVGMIGTMLPLSTFGGAKGAINDKYRVEAFNEASDRQLKMLGANEADIESFRKSKDSGSTGVRELDKLVDNLEPQGESAKEAVEEEAEEQQRAEETAADLRRLGMFPTFKTGANIQGVEVYNPETDELIGVAENGDEATAMAFEHLEMKEAEAQNAFDQVASLVEASRIQAEESTDSNATFETAPGQDMTVERMRSELLRDDSPAAAKKLERLETQIARLNALERNDGGDGALTAMIFGEMEAETRGKERALIRKLHGGASVLTLVHENAHANFKTMLEKGAVSLEETASFFKSLDQVLAGKVDRKGEQLRFLPEGVTNPTFEQLDEAVAEFAEVMLLQTKGGKKTAMRQLLKRNLSAMAKQKGVGGKFSSFIRAMRELFGLALSRTATINQAIKDGKLDKSEVEAFRALLQGTTEQEEFDADVQAEYDGTFRDEAAMEDNAEIDDDNPFSIASRISNAAETTHLGKYANGSFSIGEDKNLVAIHNLSSENLIFAHEELGAIPPPSIAVVRTDISEFNNFGDITLIAPPSLIDPGSRRDSHVWNADAYTPRFPTISYNPSSSSVSAAQEKLSEAIEATGSSKFDILKDIEDRGMEALERNIIFQYQFLAESGKAPKPKNKKRPKLPAYVKKADVSSRPSYELADDVGFQKIAARYYNEQIDAFKEDIQGHFRKLYFDKDGEVKHSLISDLVLKIKQANEATSPDWREFKSRVELGVYSKQKPFSKWLKKNFGELLEGKRIPNGHTYGGSRRYLPFNLDTVVRLMTKNIQGGENFNYGVGTIRANAAKKFRNIKAIQNSRNSIVTETEMEAFKEEVSEGFYSIAESIRPFYKYDSNSFSYLDAASQSFADLARGRWGEFKDSFENVPAEVMEEITDFLKKLTNAPTEYFEAKIASAVPIYNFSSAIIPKGSTKEVREILKSKRLKVKTYDPKIEGDRALKIKEEAERSQSSFSIGQVTPEQDSDYLAAVESGDVATQQRMVDEAAKAAGYDTNEGVGFYHGTKGKLETVDMNRVLTPEERSEYRRRGDEISDKYRRLTAPYREDWAKNYNDPEFKRLAYEKSGFSKALDEEFGQGKGSDTFRTPFELENGTFDVLRSGDLGVHFTGHERTAKSFAGPDGKVFKVYLRTGNMADVRDVFSRYQGLEDSLEEISAVAPNVSFAGLGRLAKKADKLNFHDERDWGASKPVGDFWKAFNTKLAGSDLVLRYNNEVESGGYSYTVFDSKGIKSADPVTYDSKGKVIPLSKRFDESKDSISYSIGHSSATSSLINEASKRISRPEARAKYMGDVARRLEAGRREFDQTIEAFGREVTQAAIVDPRQMKSLRKERNMREAMKREELEDQAFVDHQGILEDDTLTKLNQQPVHEFLSDPSSPLKGSLMSRGVAIGKGETFFDPSKHGDYDGAAGVSRTVFGGNLTPDQAAQELFDEGLISQPTPDALWAALGKEAESVAKMKEYLAAAKADMKDAKATAKAEADAWLDKAIKDQKRDHSPQARIRRGLVMMDAIVMALPIALRGKVGGYTALANLNSDEKRLEYLTKKIEKADQVVEKYLQEELRKEIDKLFKRAEVKKNAKGVPGSRIAADYADRIADIRDLSEMSKDQVAAEMERISDAMNVEQDQAKADALGRELAELVAFGNIDNMKAQSLEEFFENLNSVFQTGKTLKDVADAKLKEEIAAMKETTNHDVTGGGGRLTSSQAKARQKHRDTIKGLIGGLSKFHRQNISFEWLLNNLARENKAVGTLQSKTHELFARMVHVATHSEKRANMAMQQNYRDTLSGILGGLKGMKLTKRITELMQEVENSGVMRIDYLGAGKTTTKRAKASNIESMMKGDTKFQDFDMTQAEYDSAVEAYEAIQAKAKDGLVDGRRNIEYKSPNVGHSENLTLSQSQAINLLMLYRQEGLRDSMEHEGYSPETMEQMEKFLTPESIAIRDWLTQEYADNYHVINAIFRQQNGVSLPQTEFYSPARRLADGNVKDLAIDGSGGQAMSTDPNFLISRTKNFAQVDQRADALSIYMAHMYQTNHYVNWAKPIRSLRSVFSDKTVKANVEEYAGRDLLALINERVNWMADGGNRAAEHVRWLDKMRLGYTYSALAYNWGVAIKQLTSIPAYANDMGIKDFSKYAVKFMANPVKNFREMAATDYVKTRFKEGYERDVIDGLKGEGGINKKMLQTGMMFGKAGDIVPVMIGGWMARQQSLDRSKAAGLSEADAMARATIDFEMITDRSQQAGNMKDLSSFQGGGSVLKLFTMFKTSPRQYYANLYESGLDFKAGKAGAGKEFARRLFIGHIVLPMVFQFASHAVRSPFNDDEDEDFPPEDYLRAVLLGPLNGLFLAGDAIDVLASGIAGTRIWAKTQPLLDPYISIAYKLGSKEDLDFWETTDEIARQIGKMAPSPLTFYDIIRKEIDRWSDDE